MKLRYFSYIVLCLIILGGLSFFSSLNVGGAVDTDGDGYNSVSSGGDDCFDKNYANFKDVSGDSVCDSTLNPTYINLPLDVADHSWIKDESGTWHLFFSAGTPTEIYHYSTTDFATFNDLGRALATSTASFDHYGLWAPTVLKSGSGYYMFYTGVTGAGSSPTHDERIGLAISNDLLTWTKVNDPGTCTSLAGDGCVLECTAAWTLWGTNGSYTEACRDPHVVWDASNNRWVMFLTTKYTNAREIVSVAYSTDLTNWTMQGYLGVTTKDLSGVLGQLTGNIAENPFVTEYNGLYYLWFNDSSDTEDNIDSVPTGTRTMQQYATSTTLTADASGSSNWHYGGYTPLPGVNATEIIKTASDVWVMSQSVTNGNVGSEFWSEAGYRSLILQRVVWNDDGTFTSSRLSDLSCKVASSSIHPGATEVCDDNIDNSCSGEVDDAAICDPAPASSGGGANGPLPIITSGSGAGTSIVELGQTVTVPEINSEGLNLILYQGSQANFSYLDKNLILQSHSLLINNLDLENKKINITVSSDPLNLDLGLGDASALDLDHDGISDLEIKFQELVLNRIELTIKKLDPAMSIDTSTSTPELTKKLVDEENKENLPLVENVVKVFSFYRNLYRGSSGEDVYQLQKFLNSHGFTLATSGYGSSGQETEYFGPRTQGALQKFQAANFIYPAWGYFGEITRSLINKIF